MATRTLPQTLAGRVGTGDGGARTTRSPDSVRGADVHVMSYARPPAVRPVRRTGETPDVLRPGDAIRSASLLPGFGADVAAFLRTSDRRTRTV